MDDDARNRVLALLRRHGWNATSFQALEPSFSYWFDDDQEACVAYVDTGGAWVAAGAPIAADVRLADAAAKFVAAARAAGKRAAFVGVEDRFLAAAALPSLRVGEQPVWDPAAWDDVVRAHRSLREQIARARNKGVVVRLLTTAEAADPRSPVRVAVDALVDRWRSARPMAPMGFLVDVHLWEHLDDRRLLVAEQGGAIVGVLGAVPVYARKGWLLEDLLRDPRAPNGTAELLVDAMMREAARRGDRFVTLGLSPLGGDVAWPLKAVRAAAKGLYDFDGVRAFKAKLKPSTWAPIHVAYSATRRTAPALSSAVLAVVDTLAAFARGSIPWFGIRTLLRGPPIVVRVLALALVPWTALLAAAPARFFPSSSIHLAWVLFDVVLGAALLVLVRRWRRPLGLALAAIVAGDAALTTLQAALWNLPRATGPLDLAVALASVAAPTTAALVLVGAVRRTDATSR